MGVGFCGVCGVWCLVFVVFVVSGACGVCGVSGVSGVCGIVVSVVFVVFVEVFGFWCVEAIIIHLDHHQASSSSSMFQASDSHWFSLNATYLYISL